MTTSDEHPTHLDPRTVEDYFRLGVKTAFPCCSRRSFECRSIRAATRSN